MPKDRKKTYSDHQSQAARLKKDREAKAPQTKNAPEPARGVKKPGAPGD